MFPAFPLAQATGWWEMGRHFREGGSALGPAHLLIVLAVIGGVILLLWLVAHLCQRDDKRAYRSPRRLFRELCRAHELNLFDRWLLWRLATAQGLAQPAGIFLESSCFETERIPSSLAGESERITQLKERLFG